MNLRRFLRPESVRLELATRPRPDGELSDDWDPEGPRNLHRVRQGVLEEITDLLDATGAVVNRHRFFRDLHNREKKAHTALGQGIALPHVRTLQVKSFTMAFARSRDGLPFGAPDGEPVHLFFAMAAPPYDDRTYLKVYRALATALLLPGTVDEFMNAQDPNEVLLLFKRIGTP